METEGQQQGGMFKGAFERATAGMALVDPSGVVIHANGAFARLAGCDTAELVGRPYSGCLHPTTTVVRIALDGGCSLVEVSRDPSAERKAPVEVDGIPLGTVDFDRDIASRKQMELALRENEQRYRDIFDNVSDALCLEEVTPDGRVRTLELNPAFERITGIPRAGLIGKFTDESLPPDMAADFKARYRRCLDAGKILDEEVTVTLPAGLRTFHMTLIPVSDAGGRIHRIVGVTRDITLRKQHEAVLQERAELKSRLKRLAEVAPGVIGTFRRTPDGGTTLRNPSPQLEEIIGFSPQDVIEDVSVILRCLHPDDVAGYVASVDESARAMAPWHHEFRVRHPRKGEVWIEGRSIPQALAGGGIEWYGFLHDVTERKRVEAALRASELQFRTLAARREAERESMHKRIAHELHDELGQYLTALRMQASLLRVQFGPGSPALVDAVGRLTALADRTIEVVRGAASSLRPAALDMGIVSALEWLVQEFTAHSGVACELQVPQEEIVLHDDRATGVFRIVQESLTNVARHAWANQVQVSLQPHADHLRLEVRDDGQGFDPDAPRNKAFGLLGLRERVLMLGAQLLLASTPGQGTSIEVRIPFTGEAGNR